MNLSNNPALVHIKKLEIYGFKSFGFKNTVVNFSKGLVAVTGPNGSGKSNILDAILFAIGENSPKALRVDKFQSLFHDSQSNSHRLIRVGLSFDNIDRGIPVDSDLITLTREMEGQTGDSEYYLNGKKVTKTIIMELLELVMAASNKLNVVQQGMITRISELNSDERKRIIEDIIGLSYFDEKKTEALTQLDEADRRLEVAFARIGEIRKRIDELESQRNDQLRYGHLESEIKRFKAVKLSNTIRSISENLESQKRLLDSNMTRSTQLQNQLQDLHLQIQKLDSEKLKFIQDVDAANKAQAQIGNRIATIVYESERKKAIIKESELRLLHIEKRLPLVELESQEINDKIMVLNPKLDQNTRIVSDKTETMSRLKSESEEINSHLDKINTKINENSNIRAKLENRSNALIGVKNKLEVTIARLDEKEQVNRNKSQENNNRISALRTEIEKDRVLLSNLKKELESEETSLSTAITSVNNLKETKASLENELASTSNLLSRSNIITSKYETTTNVAKNLMNEDLAIAELRKHADQFGINGVVYELIGWDKSYEKAVLASSSEWMKAFVVDDVKSMLSIVEHAKTKRLPRLKIIPLELIKRTHKSAISKSDDNDIVGIIGNLAAFVDSDYPKLVEFLFGNTFIVRNPTSAFLLAKLGYRAVSVSGELFEPSGASMSVDFGSKITDLTKAILLGDSIDALKPLLLTLESSITKKTSEHKRIMSDLRELELLTIRIESKVRNINNQIFTLADSLKQAEKTFEQLILDDELIRSETRQLTYDLQKYQRRLSILKSALNKITERLKTTEDNSNKSELSRISTKKNEIGKLIEDTDFELRQAIIASTSLKGDIDGYLGRIKVLDVERDQLKNEQERKYKDDIEFRASLQSIEAELETLRNKEQHTIDSSGTSYTVLQEYETKIKSLTDRERAISKEYNTLEKDIAVIRKDISELSSQETTSINDLAGLGYKNLVESFDVDVAIEELSKEFEEIRLSINLLAYENYAQVIDGYKGMSDRKNQLELERNSILLFIEETVKEKKDVFMEAFKKVDDNIRKTFSELTGGEAWLEFENVEDELSGGIMLMVQFPSKPGRESTSLSGGEKTMAATIFLLALQSLKPSPFYLMDEIDAHLDAENTERLSKVIVDRSKDSQIIMVTLKDSIVAEASLIHGVYSKDGISQVIKYAHNNQLPLTEISHSTRTN